MGPFTFWAIMSFLADILPAPAYPKQMYSPLLNQDQITDACKPDINDDQCAIDFVFSSQLFRCLGKLAQCDGTVTAEEIQIVNNELQKMYPTEPEKREDLFEFFKSGKRTKLSFNELTDELAGRLNAYNNTDEYRAKAMMFFCRLALGDGYVHQMERQHLEYAANRLGVIAKTVLKDFLQRQEKYGRQKAQQREMEEQQKKQQERRKQEYRKQEYQRQLNDYLLRQEQKRWHYPAPEVQEGDSLDECYRILNISSTAADEEVNMAYQRKIAEFHPDRILSIAHSEAFITFAREQFQKITHAYETICKARNMN